jgi:hypothetical protein
MKCPKCGSTMEMWVSVRLNLPADYLYVISKRVIAKKECKITAADWEKCRVYCKQCKYTNKGM